MKQLIKALRPVLVEDEGVRYEIYLDHLGYATFGIGHLVTEKDPEWGRPVGSEVLEERVWSAFSRDMEQAIADAERLVDSVYVHPLEVQIVLVSLVFQLGLTRARKFKKFVAAINSYLYGVAAEELQNSKLYYQTTARTQRHMERLNNASRNSR